jgi:outer membrane protein assembly factor BamB
MRWTHLAVAALAALPAAAPAAEDAAHYWPQWRGPLGTGEAPHADPPVTWSERENVRFKVEIPGRGHSTPAVWGDRIYVTTALDTRPAEGAEPAGDRPPPRTNDSPQQFLVLALDRTTGAVVWKTQVREAVPPEGTHADGSWASASPVTDGERIWVSFGSNGLYCLDAAGQVLWETDLGDMQTRNGFGEGSSPVIHGDTLVLLWDHEGPSFIVGLDKNTGKERWRSERDERTSWSTPLVVERDGRGQAIVNATNLVRSYDVGTGEVLWEVGGMTANAIPSPVHADGTVFVMSGFRGNALLAIQPGERRGNLQGTEAIAWSYDQDTPYVPSPLLYDGALYFMKSNSGILSAFDTRTGQPRYTRQRTEPVQNVYASPVAAAGRVYIAGRDGDAVVLAHGPEYEVLATNSLDDGFDASPVPVGDTLLLRGRSHLYAIAGD